MLVQYNRRRSLRNAILADLSPSELSAIAEFCEPVALRKRMVLQEPRKPVEHLYFVETGLVSIRIVAGGSILETALVGHRGAVGAPFLVNCHIRTHQSVVVLGGNAIRIRVEDLRRLFNDRPEIEQRLLRYVEALLLHGAQTGLCGVRHGLEHRLACWLCLACDELEYNVLPVTHDYLSSVLGLRRAGVTEALLRFEEEGLVRKMRGVLKVNDLAQLETKACSCYRVISSAYEALPPVYQAAFIAQGME
jgi:CRP-like cAMP-binding protein